MSRNRLILLILLAVPALGLIVRIVIFPSSFQKEIGNEIETAVPEAALAATAQAWAKRTFTPISNPAQTEQIAASITVENSDVLSSEQSRKLREALRDFLDAYTSSNFDNYLKFRRRSSLEAAASKRALISIIRRSSPELASEFESREIAAIERKAWEVSTSARPAWLGIAVDTLLCRVDITNQVVLYQDYSPSTLLLPDGGVVATVEIPPSYAVQPSPVSVLASVKSFTTARVSCLVRVDQVNPPILYHCRFFWNPAGADWTPWTLERSFAGEDPQTVIF
jgi:hypothetical protein